MPGLCLQVSRIAVGVEPCQGTLQQLQKLSEVIGYLVELRFVQRSRPRPVNGPIRPRDIDQAAAVRADDQATALFVRAEVDNAVLLEPQQEVTGRIEEVAVADVLPGDVTDAFVEGGQVGWCRGDLGERASRGLIIVVGLAGPGWSQE